MNKTNMKMLVDLGKKYKRSLTMMNEDSKIVYADSESSKTIFDDGNELILSIRSNRDYSSKYPITLSAIEYDSIKQIDIDLTVAEAKEFIQSKGENIDDYKELLDIIGKPVGAPIGFNKIYEKEADGSYKLDANGNRIEKEPFVPSLELR